MLDKIMKSTKEGLNKLSRTTSRNPDEYIQLEEIIEDAALREIIQEKLNIYIESKGQALDGWLLEIKNLDVLTIENVKTVKTIIGPKDINLIPFGKNLEISNDKVFYNSYVSKNKFHELLNNYLLSLISLKFMNEKKNEVQNLIDIYNNKHNGYLQYVRSSETPEEIYLKLNDIDGNLLTNLKLPIKTASLEVIEGLLEDTQYNYLSILKEKVKDTYFISVDDSFDSNRIHFDDKFNFILNQDISLSNDKEDIQNVIKGLIIEKYLNKHFSLLKPYFELITFNNSDEVSILDGSIGFNASEEKLKQFGEILMSKIQDYFILKYNHSFDTSTVTEAKLDWIDFKVLFDEDNKTIEISLYNEEHLLFDFKDGYKKIK